MNTKNAVLVTLTVALTLEPLIEHKKTKPHPHIESENPLTNFTAINVYNIQQTRNLTNIVDFGFSTFGVTSFRYRYDIDYNL